MGMRLGESLSLVLFGESHATGVGVLIEGLQPGIPIDLKSIERIREIRELAHEINSTNIFSR